MVMGYRNPPTKANIARARADLERTKMAPYLKWYDYGDEIAFSEWFGMLVQEDLARAREAGLKITPAKAISARWLAWLKANRPGTPTDDYWLPTWGAPALTKLRPDSSAA